MKLEDFKNLNGPISAENKQQLDYVKTTIGRIIKKYVNLHLDKKVKGCEFRLIMSYLVDTFNSNNEKSAIDLRIKLTNVNVVNVVYKCKSHIEVDKIADIAKIIQKELDDFNIYFNFIINLLILAKNDFDIDIIFNIEMSKEVRKFIYGEFE